MKVSAVNGFSRVNVQPKETNGFSRVNHKPAVQTVNALELNAIMLNGYVVNAIDDMTDDEFEIFLADAMEPEMNGLFSRLRDRIKKRRAARQARREARRGARAERRKLRNERLRARIERIRAKAASGEPGFLDKLKEAGKQAFTGLTGVELGADELPPMSADMMPLGDDMDMDDEKGLFGPPKYEPWNPKWWTKKRVPTGQKIATGLAVYTALDFAFKGPLSQRLTGKKRRK